MPVIYDNPNQRRRFDAFKTLDEAKINPLSEMIRCVMEIEHDIERVQAAIKDPKTNSRSKAPLIAMMPKLRETLIYAWKEVAEFVYSKPKAEHFDPELQDALQKVTNKTQMLELIMKLNYPEKPPVKSESNGNGNGAGH